MTMSNRSAAVLGSTDHQPEFTLPPRTTTREVWNPRILSHFQERILGSTTVNVTSDLVSPRSTITVLPALPILVPSKAIVVSKY